MSFKSFKNEFTEVYNYLSGLCKDSIFAMPYTSESDFRWKDDKASTGVIIRYNGTDSVVKVPNGVIEIGSRDDYDIYDPDGEFGCFEECSVTDVILPKSLKIIGRCAFFQCTNLKSINIPNSVTSIGRNAFSGCENLTSINISESVESIGDYAFHECTNLTSIIIPNSVTEIGVGAFWYCENLTSIVLPNSVTSIGDYAFEDCESLESIEIPDSVESIGVFAFKGSCLRSITCSADLDLSDTKVPYGCEVIRR